MEAWVETNEASKRYSNGSVSGMSRARYSDFRSATDGSSFAGSTYGGDQDGFGSHIPATPQSASGASSVPKSPSNASAVPKSASAASALPIHPTSNPRSPARSPGDPRLLPGVPGDADLAMEIRMKMMLDRNSAAMMPGVSVSPLKFNCNT